MTAILFGSISTMVDTSELQREAFNDAFDAHGLDWSWDRDEYRSMLATSGGRDRIAAYASARDQQVDADAVHRTKSTRFQERLAASPLPPRPGVTETIAEAQRQGVQVAVVTTTEHANVAAVLDALGRDGIDADRLALVVDADQVDRPKPDAEAYTYALEHLGLSAAECIAIEDNRGGLQAASAAGVRCVAFPNANTAGHEFPDAVTTVDQVDFAQLDALINAG